VYLYLAAVQVFAWLKTAPPRPAHTYIRSINQ
jgi:hypothetical protein